MNIYVGNLSYSTTEDQLREAFEAFGQVTSAKIIVDRDTGRSRGFGFVEMSNDDEGTAAVNGMNGQDLQGRTPSVNVARRKEGAGGGGGGRNRF